MKSGESLLELKVHNLLPQTNFNNKVCGSKVTYSPELLYNNQNGNYSGAFNIMRQESVSDVQFELIDKTLGTTIHTLNLADFLNQFTQIDISKQEVLIPIEIEYKHTGVIISIPDWMINDITPGYGTN